MTAEQCDKKTDEELIALLREGSTEVIDYLMNKYKNMVRRKANALFLIGGDTDDLIQEGMIGLFKAVRDYNPGKEASFAHFADLCVNRQMYTAIEASNRKKHTPLNSYVSIYGSEKEEDEYTDLLWQLREMSPEELIIDHENVEAIRKRMNRKLSDMEKKVLSLYLQGMNYVQIAEVMDKKPKSIDNALQRIKSKLGGNEPKI